MLLKCTNRLVQNKRIATKQPRGPQRPADPPYDGFLGQALGFV